MDVMMSSWADDDLDHGWGGMGEQWTSHGFSSENGDACLPATIYTVDIHTNENRYNTPEHGNMMNTSDHQ